MKKFISAAASVVMAISSVVPYMTYAEKIPVPEFYMSLAGKNNFTIESDGTVVITPEQTKEGITLPVDIYYKDTTKTTYDVKARWGTSSDKLKIDNIKNTKSHPEMKFAYEVQVGYDFDKSANTVHANCNNFTNTDPLKLNGTESDDYPLISFDVKIAENIPEGDYEICFLQGENSCRASLRINGLTIFAYGEDEEPVTEDLKIRIGYPASSETTTTTDTTTTDGTKPTTGSSTTDGTKPTTGSSTTDGTKPTTGSSTTDGTKPTTGSSTTDGTKPTTGSFTTEGTKPTTEPSTEPPTEGGTDAPAEYSLGDVDGDGSINSSDASLVLMEYAAASTGGESVFSDEQKSVADVNGDETIDSSDASNVLMYYAYTSTTSGELKSLEEYFS